ncbi:uncharacterized protein DS421_19g655510 [Arachis hypogaea]|uniref:Uncharacterized protein n=1 Tax=Arachis hypogaea TaxID=3818 RepID=A0A6B9V7N8_ARAHY|nr:uncharacterized protein DS421_19g655510 [Arachis hypogaea]
MLLYKLTSSAMQVKRLLQWVASAALQVKGLLQWFASQVKGLLRGALPTGKPYLVKGLQMEARVTFRSLLTTICKKDSALGSLLSLGGVADDVLPFGDVPPDLSFEDLERTFPRFSSLERLGGKSAKGSPESLTELGAAKLGSQIDGGTTTESAFLGYLAIMLFCKSEYSYRGIENTRLAYNPVSQRTLTVRVCVCSSKSKDSYSESVCMLLTLARGIANREALPGQRTPGNVGSGGVADDVLPFGDVPPDLSFEDLERTFPRFSSLEGLGEYRV